MTRDAAVPWRHRVGWALAAATAVGLALAVGRVLPEQPILGLLVAGAVMMVGITVSKPVMVPLLALPLMVVVTRVSAGGVDLTVSDVALGLAFWPAVFLAPRPFSREMRQLLWLNGIYQAATLFTVIANPFLANAVEWFHAWLLVSGALVVGWAIGRSGYARIGLTALLVACMALALATVAQGVLGILQGYFGPVFPSWPWPMHKNFIGTLLGFAAAVCYVRPPWMGWPTRWSQSAFWLSCAGIAFAQSRQALIALGVILVVVSLRQKPDMRRSRLVLLIVPPGLWVVATMVRDDIASGNVHNSIFQRLTWFEDTLQIWAESPWLGQGLRYWYTDRVENPFQPPNALLEVGATSGLVGLAAFLVFAIGSLIVLWRMDPTYGMVAVAVVLSRIVQSQFDLFWVSITVSIPFAIAGVAIGAAARAEFRGQSVRKLSPRRAGAVSAGTP